MDWKKTLLISLGILAAGVAVTLFIFNTEPTAQRTGASKETAMLVDVVKVDRGDFQPTIQVMGTVRPSQDIMLSPRVRGQITRRSPSFTPGGYVEEGDTLLQINPADYKNRLQQRRSELQQAQADLNIEKGRQEVARQEFQLIGDTLPGMNRALVLREPQLQSARSEVTSARAAYDQARLDLSRTTITAPFDAHILSRNVNVGSQVAPGETLGRLVGRDTYWVEATVPVSKLRWLTFPDGGNDQGSAVRIRNRTAWPDSAYRQGYLYKLVGTLEDETRMARVLVEVPDPLAYEMENDESPSLMIGSYVEAHIETRPLDDIIRVDRDYLRENETIWVMKDQQLHINDVDIAFQDARYAYIRDGLTDDAQVVTTNLATVEEGAPLRLEASSPVEQDTTNQNESNAVN